MITENFKEMKKKAFKNIWFYLFFTFFVSLSIKLLKRENRLG